jgi:hypothetical protein
LVLGLSLKGWIAILAIPALIVMIWCSRRADRFYNLLVAIILAIEFLSDNVGGCEKQYPSAVAKARATVDRYLSKDRTRLLDIYLPHRTELPDGYLAELASARAHLA